MSELSYGIIKRALDKLEKERQEKEAAANTTQQ
jgi:hypothetical protein